MAFSRPFKVTAQALIGVSLAVVPIVAPTQAASPRAGAPPLVVAANTSGFVRNFNFLSGSTPLEVGAVIYEPLYICSYDDNAKETPWLATAYKWSKDLRTLHLTIRQGVRWSDGQPFSARDVYFTYMLGKENPNTTLNQEGMWGPNGFVDGVTLIDATHVDVHFTKPDVTIFDGMVNSFYILPAHIWSKIKDPVHFTNPNPVGTGPYTQVENFSTQSYDLGRNPYYWQKLSAPVLRTINFTTNDSLLLSLESGKLDWANAFVPKVSQTYDARNPTYFHHYFNDRNAPSTLYTNDVKYPFSVVDFRKALSMAINREAISTNADYGYAPPSRVTGLNGLWPTWDDKSIPNTLAEYNPSAAQALLKHAGFTLKNGKLIDPKGHPVAFDVSIPIAPDTLATAQILVQNFQALGIDAHLNPLQGSDFYDRLGKGEYDVGISGSPVFATPYGFYYGLLGKKFDAPIGQPAGADAAARWWNPTLEQLVKQFRHTLDVRQQHAIVDQMERIFVKYLPVIPLTITENYAEYNMMHYTGYPSASDNYAAPQFSAEVDRLLVFPRLTQTR